MATTTRPTAETILEVALELFSTQGYETTTIRQIAQPLGITPAALYYHYPSKLAILEAIVGPYLERVAALLERFPPTSTATPTAKRDLLAGYAALVVGSPRIANLVGRGLELESHPDLGPRIQGLVNGLTDRLAAPAGDDRSRLRATAAIGAIRRPILRTEIDHEPLFEDLIEAAMAVLGPS